MITLAPMDAQEFAAYLAHAVPAFAQDKVESGQWTRESSLDLARQGYDALLPAGLETPDHCLFTLRDDATRQRVGMLWYAIQEQAGRRIAYVYDVLIDAAHRRRGHATQAFAALEERVVATGLAGIALHVFGHNDVARALYARLGYRPTNINLFKTVSTTDR